MLVISPARPEEMPSPCSISSRTGPMLFTAVRRLNPVSTIATATRSRPRRCTGGLGGAAAVTSRHLPPDARDQRSGSPARVADPLHPRDDPGHPVPDGLLQHEGGGGGQQDADEVD